MRDRNIVGRLSIAAVLAGGLLPLLPALAQARGAATDNAARSFQGFAFHVSEIFCETRCRAYASSALFP